MTDLARHRLHQQGLTQHPFSTAAEVVGWLGAVQAQDYPAALWALGLRLPKTDATQIDQAAHDLTILRTWLMRGTLHFVRRDDAGWLVALLGHGPEVKVTARHRQLELDAATLARSADLLHAAVHDQPGMRRSELFAMLERAGISPAGQRGVHMLAHASQRGLLVQGAQIGRDPTFYALAEVAPSLRLSREEAVAELARRYFTGHGPAALADFIWWSGLRTTEARAGLHAVEAELDRFDVNGQTYWQAAHPAPPPLAEPVGHLLPAYDEFLIGYADRSASLAREDAHRVQNANGLGAAISVDGRIIGTWTREVKRNAVVIHARPFSDWTDDATRAATTAAERYGEFVGKAAALRVVS